MYVPKSISREKKKLTSAVFFFAAKVVYEIELTELVGLYKIIFTSAPRSCVQTSLRSICTHNLGQDAPI